AVDGVADLEGEPLDLGGGDVDVVGGGEVVVVGGAEEAVAVGEDLEDADLPDHPLEHGAAGLVALHVRRPVRGDGVAGPAHPGGAAELGGGLGRAWGARGAGGGGAVHAHAALDGLPLVGLLGGIFAGGGRSLPRRPQLVLVDVGLV